VSDDTSLSKAPADFWRTFALTLLGVVITLCGCIYSQDRDHLTKQDLTPVAQNVQDTQQQVYELKREVEFMRGQLVAKRVINP
jgi:hypothetical protein